MRWFLLLIGLWSGGRLFAEKGMLYTDAKTGVGVLTAEIELPSEGTWYLAPTQPQRSMLGFAWIQKPHDAHELAAGKRTSALQLRKKIEERERRMSLLRYRLRHQREDFGGQSPESWQKIDLSHDPALRTLLEDGTLAVLSGVPLRLSPEEEPQALVVELHPWVDDGKHWVYDNRYGSERVDIDPVWLEKHGLEVTPKPLPTETPDTLRYTLYARVLNPDLEHLTLNLRNDFPQGDRHITVGIAGTTDDRSGFSEWAKGRAFFWTTENTRLGRMWEERATELYGVDLNGLHLNPNRRNRGETASVMNVFGGDAAIRETLQMQNLEAGEDRAPPVAPTLPVSEIKGVTVKAHDYGELLRNERGGTLEMASFCPRDRLFVWFPEPAGLVDLLEGGGGVLDRLRNLRAERVLDHQVIEKHLRRMGLTRGILIQILESGLIGETAWILPDLFLMEGTDVTSVSRVEDLSRLRTLLNGFSIAAGENISSMRTPTGDHVFWVVSGEWLIVGSQQSEVEKVRARIASDGEDSLGRSEEFRYMLTLCPPSEHTRAYVYISDPFIRRLTGPAVKIAQLRRLQAKAELERLAAGHLLYQVDHQKAAPDWRTLVDAGYAPAPSHLRTGDMTWDQGVATDPIWGSAAHLSTLLPHLPDRVTPAEKKAYESYRTRYEQFWRQFFDPIAINAESMDDGSHETTVFVLPLINSSIYDLVRQWFNPEDERRILQRPVIEPPPIGMVSLNLNESVWVDAMEGVSSMVDRAWGIHFPIWEYMGPGFHFGIADSDAILTFGGGEFMELFSGGAGVRNREMLAVPIFGALLTRPVVLAVDLTDPEAARNALRAMPTGTLAENNGLLELNVDLTRITGRDRWLIRLTLGDMVNLTLGMEIQDRYLVLSNMPLSYHPRVTGSENHLMRDGAILLRPGAIDHSAPGFVASALNAAGDQAKHGLAILELYRLAGVDGLSDAMALSDRLFGYKPVHPTPGEFLWKPESSESGTFGSLFESRHPPLDDVDIPGLFPKVHQIDVSLQLEREGLRTRLHWR